jgi:hypothetical protein
MYCSTGSTVLFVTGVLRVPGTGVPEVQYSIGTSATGASLKSVENTIGPSVDLGEAPGSVTVVPLAGAQNDETKAQTGPSSYMKFFYARFDRTFRFFKVSTRFPSTFLLPTQESYPSIISLLNKSKKFVH